MTTDIVARNRHAAKTYGVVGRDESHRPVATVAPDTCGTCGHIIGWKAEQDPIHAVAGACKCGAAVGPFKYECPACATERQEAHAAAVAARLAEFVAEDASGGEQAEDNDRDPADHGLEVNPTVKEAKEYLAKYDGTFDFLRSMKERAFGPKGVRGPLSQRQAEAILRCKKADEDRAARAAQATKERVQTGRDLNQLPEGRTYAAVDNDSGNLTFLIIDRPEESNKWAGWVFVKQQVGNDENRLGAQRPGETYVGQWANLIDKVLADPIAAVARYGLELGVCGVCARKLTNEESREQGIGPVCRAKLEAGF